MIVKRKDRSSTNTDPDPTFHFDANLDKDPDTTPNITHFLTEFIYDKDLRNTYRYYWNLWFTYRDRYKAQAKKIKRTPKRNKYTSYAVFRIRTVNIS